MTGGLTCDILLRAISNSKQMHKSNIDIGGYRYKEVEESNKTKSNLDAIVLVYSRVIFISANFFCRLSSL